MAMDVRLRRLPCPAHRLHPVRRARVDEVAGDASATRRARVPTMRDAFATIFSPTLPAADDGDVGAVPHLDHRTLGGIDLRAHGHDATGGPELARAPQTPRARRRTAGWCSPSARSSAASRRRSSPNVSAGGKRWPSTSPSWGSASSSRSGTCSTCGDGALTVLLVHLPARVGRRQLRAVHAVAAGAVPDRLPRERDRLHQLGRPLRRRGDGVSRGLRAFDRTAASASPWPSPRWRSSSG